MSAEERLEEATAIIRDWVTLGSSLREVIVGGPEPIPEPGSIIGRAQAFLAGAG